MAATEKDRILVLDDEAPVRDLLYAMLHDEYEVELAKEGQEAVEKCRTTSYAAILVDIALPGKLDGFQVVEQVRGICAEIRTILITGLALSPEARQRAAAVADALLIKPFDIEDVKSLLRRLTVPDEASKR